MQQLNLGTGNSYGTGSGVGSKKALTEDLVGNLDKELDKLKRSEENIKIRRHIAMKGDRSILDETEEDRKKQKDNALYEDMVNKGNSVLSADQQRVQVLRHRVGQLDSVLAVPYEELEAMRLETAEKVRVLQE